MRNLASIPRQLRAFCAPSIQTSGQDERDCGREFPLWLKGKSRADVMVHVIYALSSHNNNNLLKFQLLLVT